MVDMLDTLDLEGDFFTDIKAELEDALGTKLSIGGWSAFKGIIKSGKETPTLAARSSQGSLERTRPGPVSLQFSCLQQLLYVYYTTLFLLSPSLNPISASPSCTHGCPALFLPQLPIPSSFVSLQVVSGQGLRRRPLL